MLYACHYDRWRLPLEFWSSAAAAHGINQMIRNPNWPGSKRETNEFCVEKWRQSLHLPAGQPRLVEWDIHAGGIKLASESAFEKVFGKDFELPGADSQK
jgi:hypothetical protein